MGDLALHSALDAPLEEKKTYLMLTAQNCTRLGPDSCPCDQCRCSFLGVIAPSRLPLLVLAVFGDLRVLDSTASLVTLFDFVSFCLFCSFWLGCPPTGSTLSGLGSSPVSRLGFAHAGLTLFCDSSVVLLGYFLSRLSR